VNGRCRRAALYLLLSGCIAGPAGADATQKPIVRLEITPDTITVGESATLRVTVLVPTWQPQPPVFPDFEVPNAITQLPPDSSHPMSERIGRDTWSGIVRNYRVTPLIPATFSLGGESIRVTWAEPGAANHVLDVPVPDASLAATVPQGAAGIDPYLAGTRFELERTLEGDTASLTAGDALVIHYRAVLSGMPALFIPPIAPALTGALATAYPKEPVLRDGDAAERLEAVTLVLNHGGTLTLPGRTFDWWNRAEGRVEQVSLEPVTVTVAGPAPDTAPESTTGTNRRLPIALSAVTLVLLLGLWRWLPRYRTHRRAARAAYEASEAHAFRQLTRADTAGEIYRAAIDWLERLDPALDLQGFAAGFGDPSLRDALGQLSAQLYGGGNGGDGGQTEVRHLMSEFRRARRRYLAQATAASGHALAPLNPQQTPG